MFSKTTTTLLAAFASLANANSTPIYGSHPGYTVGNGKSGITIEIFMDYLCSACRSENPVLEKVLQKEWLGSTVEDQIFVKYTPFPLPYHTHSYEVNRLVPYFMDLCITGGPAKCFNNEYRDFSFDQLENVLSMKDVSKDDFIISWSETVAIEFGLDASDIEAAYADR